MIQHADFRVGGAAKVAVVVVAQRQLHLQPLPCGHQQLDVTRGHVPLSSRLRGFGSDDQALLKLQIGFVTDGFFSVFEAGRKPEKSERHLHDGSRQARVDHLHA